EVGNLRPAEGPGLGDRVVARAVGLDELVLARAAVAAGELVADLGAGTDVAGARGSDVKDAVEGDHARATADVMHRGNGQGGPQPGHFGRGGRNCSERHGRSRKQSKRTWLHFRLPCVMPSAGRRTTP